MPTPILPVLEFLKTRRSCPAKTLTTPVPDRAEVMEMLEMAARTPDHKKLEPWRFIVLEQPALLRLSALATTRYDALNLPEEKAAKNTSQYADADLAVAVIASPKDVPTVPQVEQILSAGAVCLALVNAALASGWGANWLSGPMAFDREFLRDGLGLESSEFVAGFIHIGTKTCAPPERPRPDLESITQWVKA